MLGSALLIAYGMHGVAVNALYLPGRGVAIGVARDGIAWVMLFMFICTGLGVSAESAGFLDKYYGKQNFKDFVKKLQYVGLLMIGITPLLLLFVVWKYWM